MFGLEVLDIALGLILIYLILSLICTSANELIAQMLQKRARTLLVGIYNLLEGTHRSKVDLKALGEDRLIRKFYDHPLVKALYEDGKKPSYVSARTFSVTLLDLVAPVHPDGSRTMAEIRGGIQKLPESSLQRALLILLNEAQSDLGAFQANLETWYDESMERVSGWYKAKTQRVILVLALLVTVLANADTIYIASQLASNNTLREVMASQAVAYAEESPDSLFSPTGSPVARTQAYIDTYGGLGIPVGWHRGDLSGGVGYWLSKVLGLLLTAFAVSLGAPFWFDVLKKVATVRASGDPLRKAPPTADGEAEAPAANASQQRP